ncbi:MAG TPA: geranylgeranyl reductase family protein [Acidimicrobiales bacterium]|nr:geranylgeranyl reductase family protein [Acidimicrobiales bacterium]
MTSPTDSDVVVVGAGPAGTAAAVVLARAGLRVTCLDRAVFPRDKCCGDGLTASALHQLEGLGLRPEAVASWWPVAEVVLASPSGRRVELTLPDSGLHAAVARRFDLDAALVELARRQGAEVVEGARVTRAEVDIDRVTLTTADGRRWRAGYVLGCDGVWSPLRKLVCPRPEARAYLGEWHAFRQYRRSDSPEARRLWVWFEPDLLPGYAWSFPLADGWVNFGFGVPRRPGEASGRLGSVLSELARRPGIAPVIGSEGAGHATPKAWPIPAAVASGLLSAAGGRVLFAGDAARAADPLTGEGIGQALETGAMAATAVLAAGAHRPGHAADHYRRRVGAGLAVDNRLAGRLSRLLATPLGARAALRAADGSAWTRANFARWMWEDYPRAVLVTPGRWRRGMLRPSGAFAPGAPAALPA